MSQNILENGLVESKIKGGIFLNRKGESKTTSD